MFFRKNYAFNNVFDAWQVYCQAAKENAGRVESAGKAGKTGKQKRAMSI
jgi:hypothetical protein